MSSPSQPRARSSIKAAQLERASVSVTLSGEVTIADNVSVCQTAMDMVAAHKTAFATVTLATHSMTALKSFLALTTAQALHTVSASAVENASADPAGVATTALYLAVPMIVTATVTALKDNAVALVASPAVTALKPAHTAAPVTVNALMASACANLASRTKTVVK